MPVSRLQSIPWSGLEGLSPQLLPALDKVLRGAPADATVAAFFRAHRAFTGAHRTAVAEALFGVALWRRRLAYHAHGDEQGPAVSPRPLLFCLLRDLAGIDSHLASSWSGLAPPEAPPVRPPPSDFAVRWSLPDWLADLLVRELSPEADAFAAALNEPGPICIRANTLKTTRAELTERLRQEGIHATPAPYAPHALHLDGRPNILGSPSHQHGLFEVQDEGSQLIGALVAAHPGETVLDLCAGAGGKSLLLAAEVSRTGQIFAFDSDRPKLERLRTRAQHAGAAACVRILSNGVPPDLVVDHVLVDAPCSALGALRRGPDVRFRLQPETFSSFPVLQASLLEQAARHVRAGGTLVYATCTLRREENEAVAHAFEQSHSHFERMPIEQGPSFTREGYFVCLPHRHGTDGFFGARYRRQV
jgi:16S rRNA (cytosine967-C5)-methyltransferase